MPRDQYGDWCVPPESQELIHSNDPNRKTAGPLIGTAYFVHDLDLMAQYASLLGKQDDAKGYQAAASDMRAAFNRAFWNEEKKHYDNGTQTTSVLALAFNLVPDEKRETIIQHLTRSIMEDHNGHTATGLIGMQWLMRSLTENGGVDVAYTIATKRDYPSWGYMIDHGATTIWELWNGNTADPGMNSHNHVMLLGDLVTWFYEYLGGIRTDPSQPGFKKVILNPYLPAGLSSVDASYNSLYGMIVSKWSRDQKTFTWEVTIPANTVAEIHVPSASTESVTEGGMPVSQSRDIQFLRQEKGASIYTAPAGQYVFKAVLP